MFSLGEHFYQALRVETLKVDAGGGWGYSGEHGQLGARACATVEQGVEHASAGGFSDGGGNFGGGCVGVFLYIHSLMIDEVSLSGNRHTPVHAANEASSRTRDSG
jgi:hypothetical protein